MSCSISQWCFSFAIHLQTAGGNIDYLSQRVYSLHICWVVKQYILALIFVNIGHKKLPAQFCCTLFIGYGNFQHIDLFVWITRFWLHTIHVTEYVNNIERWIYSAIWCFYGYIINPVNELKCTDQFGVYYWSHLGGWVKNGDVSVEYFGFNGVCVP